jgi:hypothetical protein
MITWFGPPMGTSAIRAGCERRADGTVVEVLGDQAAGPERGNGGSAISAPASSTTPQHRGPQGSAGWCERMASRDGRLRAAGCGDAFPRVLDGSIGRLFPAATVACVDPSPMVEGVNRRRPRTAAGREPAVRRRVRLCWMVEVLALIGSLGDFCECSATPPCVAPAARSNTQHPDPLEPETQRTADRGSPRG